MCDLQSLVNLLGVLGIVEDLTEINHSKLETLIKVVVIVVDFVSTLLDWQVFFRLVQQDFRLVGESDGDDFNGLKIVMACFYFLILVTSHSSTLRGKWFYLNDGNRDWYAYAITETFIFAVEDVSTIFIFLMTVDFYSNDNKVDRLNVILSNINGYVVVLLFWYRVLLPCANRQPTTLPGLKQSQQSQQQQPPQQQPAPVLGANQTAVPCMGYFWPIWVTILSFFVSYTSYVTLFQEYWVDEDGDGVFDNVSTPQIFPMYVAPFSMLGMGAVTLVIALAMDCCCWARCLSWIGRGQQTGGQHQPAVGRQDHNLWLFLGTWTAMFLFAMFLGWVTTA